MAALTSKNARLSHQLATFGIGRDFTALWLLDEDFSFETSMTSVSSPNDFWISKPFAMTGVLAWQVIRCSMKFDWCVQGGDRMGLNSRVLSQEVPATTPCSGGNEAMHHQMPQTKILNLVVGVLHGVAVFSRLLYTWKVQNSIQPP